MREALGQAASPDAGLSDEGSPQPVRMKINQETLAEMFGAIRSRVNFFMNKFRKQGFVDLSGNIMSAVPC
jgi:CRP/FNR family transcriptional regulator, cyclic AMP receptor protein